jgi:HKD family nuclease
MSAKDNGINLHELLKKRSYDHGLISTFTFSVRFFEEYALDRFKALQNNSNLTVFLDRGEYEEILTATTATKDWSPRLANLRYLLHPIRVPGVFHPKVFLFANAKHGLLVIGSANFSQDGLGANAELVSTFEFELGSNETALPLFQSAFQFFADLVDRWPGKEAASNVDEIRRSVAWLTDEAAPQNNKYLPLFLSNLNEPLWQQLLRQLPDQVDEISLVSRFFDSSPAMLETITQEMRAARISIYTQAVINTLSPAWLEHSMSKNGRMKIHLCRYQDGDHSQQLHGKAYAFRSGKKIALASGSANFSTAALLRPAKSGNVEVLLFYPSEAIGQFDPVALFDPLQTATELKSGDQLSKMENQTTEPESRAKNFSCIIREAALEDDDLILEMEEIPKGLECRVCQANARPVVLILGTSAARVKLAPGLAKKMANSPSVVQLGNTLADEWHPVSNPTLVISLLGPESGRNSRQHRRIREAMESPQRFMGILRELCESDDETRLRNFLTHCDIPFDLIARSLGKRQSKGGLPTGPPTELKDLGKRNLRHFDLLHDAVMNFASRHRRKLEKHVEHCTAAGIANFLHILESILLLLHSQIERAAAGLEADASIILTPEEWKNVRDHLSDYYQELESLLRLTTYEYLKGLLKSEKLQVVREYFVTGSDEMLGIITLCIQMRNRINTARIDRVKVRTQLGNTGRAQFFGEQISDEKWSYYVSSLKKLAEELRKQISAA